MTIRFLLPAFLGSSFVAAVCAQTLAPAERAAYAAVGSAFADNMRIPELDWTEAHLEAFIVGLRASHAGKSYPLDADGQRLLESIQRRLSSPAAAGTSVSPTQITRYLQMARQQFAMQQSESGLLYRLVRSGVGVRPRMQDTVVLTFTALKPDAKTEVPEISGQAVRVKMADLVPGLAEGVQRLALGAGGVFVVPPDLSYGSGEWPQGIERGAPIIFQVELLDVIPDSSEARGP